jgi:GNAT superfamily N-acetyltransferase
MAYEIGLARPDEVPPLPEIERRACDLFLQSPLTAALPLDLTPLADLEAGQRGGLLWVARIPAGGPVGFALVEELDGELHLEELDVLPEHGRQGLGTALVRRVLAWVKERGRRSVTLCTFRDIPWNAPFYRRLGFRELTAEELTPALRRRIQREAENGLPTELRVAMRFVVPQSEDVRGPGRSWFGA